jgi:hypothetical protein
MAALAALLYISPSPAEGVATDIEAPTVKDIRTRISTNSTQARPITPSQAFIEPL